MAHGRIATSLPTEVAEAAREREWDAALHALEHEARALQETLDEVDFRRVPAARVRDFTNRVRGLAAFARQLHRTHAVAE